MEKAIKFCWGIGKRLIMNGMVILLFTTIFMILGTSHCFAWEKSDKIIQELLANPKLNSAETIIQNFLDGKDTAKVIVNLKDSLPDHKVRKLPSGVRTVRNFKDKKVRKKLKQDVKAVQKSVINALNKDDVRVSTLFIYVYGFSAEVTVQGLQELIMKIWSCISTQPKVFR